jgi:hypothetical protein
VLGLPMGKVGAEVAHDLCILYSGSGMVDLAAGLGVHRCVGCCVCHLIEAAEVVVPPSYAQ